MTRASKPTFVVWTRDVADEDSWRVELQTDNLAAAAALADQLGTDEVIATIYERGRFEAGGRQHTDFVLFWWSEAYDEAMGGMPSGRGEGWSEEHDSFVSYTTGDSGALAASGPAALVSASPSRRYRIVHCSRCGLKLPQNEAVPYTHDVKVGSSSGTYRSDSSFTQRVSSRSFSTSSTSRSSSSSGRTYYRRETLLLCADCGNAQVEADRLARQQFRRMIVAGVVLVVLLLIFHGGK